MCLVGWFVGPFIVEFREVLIRAKVQKRRTDQGAEYQALLF